MRIIKLIITLTFLAIICMPLTPLAMTDNLTTIATDEVFQDTPEWSSAKNNIIFTGDDRAASSEAGRKNKIILILLCAFVIIPSTFFAFPSVYPTGTTIYKPEKCWNGYTIMSDNPGTALFDMNGKEVKRWDISAGGPNRILPGGYLMTCMNKGKGSPTSMAQVDWDGNIVWQFSKFEKMSVPPAGAKGAAPGDPPEEQWTSTQHHDWQREGAPTGYYAPGMEPMVDKGKTLILGRTSLKNSKINSNMLNDDVIYEVSWDGEVLWKWQVSDHVDEMGFNDDEFKSMQSRSGPLLAWFWCNCASWLGPNKWYDSGDERFHPDNIIWDSKTTNILGITDRKTGKIVWKVGPRYDASPQLKKLGWIIGPHKTHMIPKGLPGAGNILVYDNGGSDGYGTGSPNSSWLADRDYSRIIEFDPVTLEIVWEYSGKTLGLTRQNWFQVYSQYISGAQRLPNGNTLITEGATGRVTEVTQDLDTVWEYVSPHLKTPSGGPGGLKPTAPTPKVYRSYRVPYEWVPQLKKPREVAVIPPGNQDFKVQGTGDNYKGYVEK